MKKFQIAILVIAAGLVIGLGYSTVYRSGPHQFGNRTWGSKAHRTDFTVYHEAGRAVLAGDNIYEVSNRRGWVYQYLPVFAVAMTPLALLSVFWASLVWYLMSVAMLAHTVWIYVRLARQFFPNHRLPDFWVGTFAAGLLLWPAMSGIVRGQASLLLMWLMSLSVWLQIKERPWSAGLALSAAIVLKIFPALLLIYWAVKRQWMAALATSVWLAALVFVVPCAAYGVSGNIELLRQWVMTVAMPANQPNQSADNLRYKQMISPYIARNQSVQAVAIRWIAGAWEETADHSRELLARKVAMGINLALLAVSVWACRRREMRWGLVEACVVIQLMLFLAPVSWSHNYTLLVMPVAVAVALALGEGSKPMRWALGVFTVAVMLAVTVKLFHIYGTLLCGTLALWAGFICWLMQGSGSHSDDKPGIVRP